MSSRDCSRDRKRTEKETEILWSLDQDLQLHVSKRIYAELLLITGGINPLADMKAIKDTIISCI